MPRLTDASQIRTRLEHDRTWAAYALGDLQPGYWEQSEWYGPEGESDFVALLYRAARPPVLMTCGEASGLAAVLAELPPEPELMLSVRPDALAVVRRRWEVPKPTAMWRMLLAEHSEGALPAAEALSMESLGEMVELFRDGRPTGEEPDFFLPEMLRDGVYYGARDAGGLVAAAGTHLVAAREDVATIGNVYTRRDRRAQGHGRTVTGAVVLELRRRGIGTIVLNVRQTNAAAIRVYESLGFRRYCPFYEGLALLSPANR